MMGKNKIKITWLTAMALASLIFIAVAQQNNVLEDTPSGTALALTANLAAPEFVKIQFLDKLPAVSPEEQQRREEILKKTHLPVPQPHQELDPQVNAQTVLIGAETNATNLQSDPNFTIFNNSALGTTIPSGFKSTVGEPSAANSGNYVFYTGNWYVARSTNGGLTFSYINPYADMPSFCCDQDVLYDQNRDIFIWYRQGVSDANGVNFFRLGISNDKGASWFFYNVKPTNINRAWTNQWWDYPRLALSNNYLYIASNMFNNADSWTRTVILAFPLDALKNHTRFSFGYYASTTNFNFAPVQGATTTIYWGTHNTNDNFRVFSWKEGETRLNFYDRAIPVWTLASGAYSCPGPDGRNWCARSDSRVLSGWVANGTIGFFWNVMQGGGFPYPYINAATFRESDKSYTGRPLIWNSNYAFLYGDAAPDNRGHLGISLFWGGGSYYPNHAVGIDDDFNGAPPPWEVVATNIGTNGPSDNQWGDYVRARSYNPSGLLWAATGYTLHGGNTGSSTDPRYIIFGRERDKPASTQ